MFFIYWYCIGLGVCLIELGINTIAGDELKASRIAGYFAVSFLGPIIIPFFFMAVAKALKQNDFIILKGRKK